MAVTLDTALGTGNASSALSATFNTTAAVAAGGTVIAIAGRWQLAGTSTMSMTAGGNAMTLDHAVSSGLLRISVFRLNFPAGLAPGSAITVTCSAANNDIIIGAGSFLGIDTSGTVTAFNGGGGSTSAWTSGNVAGNAGDALIGGTFRDGGTSTASTPGDTELYDFNVGGQNETLVQAYTLSIAGTDAVNGTYNGTATWVAAAVSYKPAAGGGGVTVKKLAALGVG